MRRRGDFGHVVLNHVWLVMAVGIKDPVNNLT